MDKNEIIRQVADTIRLERHRKKLSQDKLAEQAGISTKYLNSIENGKANPSIVVVVSICKVLELDLCKLIEH